MHAILGAKNPHLQTYLVGGMSITLDPNSESAINADKLANMKVSSRKRAEFVEQVYIPDLLAVASFYKDWAGLGEGLGNFLVLWRVPQRGRNPPFPQGIILNRDLKTCSPGSSRRSPNMSPAPGTNTTEGTGGQASLGWGDGGQLHGPKAAI